MNEDGSVDIDNKLFRLWLAGLDKQHKQILACPYNYGKTLNQEQISSEEAGMNIEHFKFTTKIIDEWGVKLKEGTIPPLGTGLLIARNFLVVPEESETLDLIDQAEFSFNNTEIAFPLDVLGGAGAIDNDDNWGLTASGYNIQHFWELGAKGQGVRVGIADSGLDATHETFAELIADNRLKAFASFAKDGKKENQRRPDGTLVPDSEAISTASHWHGTHCAGIIAGQATEGKLRGVAPDSELVVAQVLQQGNIGTVLSINSGLLWLLDQQCDIVSLSLGWPGKHEEWADAIQQLVDQGSVVVAASGNELGVPGEEPTRSPANYPVDSDHGMLISVGAINQEGFLWEQSGGEEADWNQVTVPIPGGGNQPSRFAHSPKRIIPTMVAPGVDIISASPPNNAYRSSTGTSMATPHIAGLIALVLSILRTKNAQVTPRQAALLVMQSLTPLATAGADIRAGNGVVDTEKLIEKIKEQIS